MHTFVKGAKQMDARQVIDEIDSVTGDGYGNHFCGLAEGDTHHGNKRWTFVILRPQCFSHWRIPELSGKDAVDGTNDEKISAVWGKDHEVDPIYFGAMSVLEAEVVSIVVPSVIAFILAERESVLGNIYVDRNIHFAFILFAPLFLFTLPSEFSSFSVFSASLSELPYCGTNRTAPLYPYGHMSPRNNSPEIERKT